MYWEWCTCVVKLFCAFSWSPRHTAKCRAAASCHKPATCLEHPRRTYLGCMRSHMCVAFDVAPISLLLATRIAAAFCCGDILRSHMGLSFFCVFGALSVSHTQSSQGVSCRFPRSTPIPMNGSSSQCMAQLFTIRTFAKHATADVSQLAKCIYFLAYSDECPHVLLQLLQL